MLGIPTCSDVEDERYQEALKLDILSEQLSRWPTSYNGVHNHVVRALRLSGNDVFEARNVYEECREVGNVGSFLIPSMVHANLINSVQRYGNFWEEARNSPQGHMVTKENWVESTHRFDDGKRRELSSLVRTAKPRLLLMRPQGYRPVVRYEWVPFDLAQEELGAFESGIGRAYDASSNPVQQVHRMWQVVDLFNDNPNKSFIADHPPRLVDPFEVYGMEHTAGSEPTELRYQNEEVGDRSDIYVRFDEWYVVCNNGMLHVPVPDESRFDLYTLGHRQTIRDIALGTVADKGSVSFNGVNYKVVGPNGTATGYTAEAGEPQQFFVNILGLPVSGMDPEEWALREIELVKDYRDGKTGAAQEIMHRYNVGDDPLRTRDDELNSVMYTLDKPRWTLLNERAG